MGKKKDRVFTEYVASSKDDLLGFLKQCYDMKLPPRTKGRTTQHREKLGMLRLMTNWANTDFLSYPMTLVHRDKPDFLLCYGNKDVGIEFTEAISEEFAATSAQAERDDVEALFYMDQFKRGTGKRTASERRQIIQSRPSGHGWANEQAEYEWAQSIMDAVNKKTAAFNKPGFKKCDKNWLLIDDNLPVGPLSSKNLETAMGYLSVALKGYWLQKNRYDEVIIETGNRLVQIDPARRVQRRIADL